MSNSTSNNNIIILSSIAIVKINSIKYFIAVADELIYSKRIKGSISGGRQANVSTYIPDIYSRSQSEWVDSFLKQNGYLGKHEFLY